MMNSLLIKFYNKYAIIYVQHSPKKIYIKHYNIIRASHGQQRFITNTIIYVQYSPKKKLHKT